MLNYDNLFFIIFFGFIISFICLFCISYYLIFQKKYNNYNVENETLINDKNTYSEEKKLRNNFEEKYNRKIDDNDIYLVKKHNNSIDFNLLITWLILNEDIVNKNFNNINNSLKCEEEMNNFNNEKYNYYRYDAYKDDSNSDSYKEDTYKDNSSNYSYNSTSYGD